MAKFALLIGAGRFDDRALGRLHAPKQDIEAFAELLRDANIGGFDEAEILHDVPFAEAFAAIGRLTTGKDRDDTILLYYSGHGQPDERGNLFLTTRDTQIDNLAGTSLAASAIRERLREGRSVRYLLPEAAHDAIVASGCYGG